MIMKCAEILNEVSALVSGDRAAQNGPKLENHQNIADHWNAYLGPRIMGRLTPLDVSLMMVEFKIARTKLGAHNPDNYKDMAGYAAISGELADELPNSGRDTGE